MSKKDEFLKIMDTAKEKDVAINTTKKIAYTFSSLDNLIEAQSKKDRRVKRT